MVVLNHDHCVPLIHSHRPFARVSLSEQILRELLSLRLRKSLVRILRIRGRLKQEGCGLTSELSDGRRAARGERPFLRYYVRKSLFDASPSGLLCRNWMQHSQLSTPSQWRLLTTPRFPPVGQHTSGLALQEMPRQKGSSEETFDVMEIADYTKKQKWWKRVFGTEEPGAEKSSVAKQLVIGGVTGWCAGYLCQKVGKLAASAVGGGFLLLQIANHTGYITVNWKRVERDVNKAKSQLKLNTERPPKEVRTKAQEVQTFVKKNLVLTGGFAGGFLIGLAS
ncbi:hypothetical protein GJAV_G00136170 [Gymnothorax javanicus]|nr:hypothetical protein GJAV_G00136170 [Gymnothorax javanicus]